MVTVDSADVVRAGEQVTPHLRCIGVGIGLEDDGPTVPWFWPVHECDPAPDFFQCARCAAHARAAFESTLAAAITQVTLIHIDRRLGAEPLVSRRVDGKLVEGR